MTPWRFGAAILAGLAAFYLTAAVVVFVISGPRQLVTEGILATGSALAGALIVLLTKGWGDKHRDEKDDDD